MTLSDVELLELLAQGESDCGDIPNTELSRVMCGEHPYLVVNSGGEDDTKRC